MQVDLISLSKTKKLKKLSNVNQEKIQIQVTNLSENHNQRKNKLKNRH